MEAIALHVLLQALHDAVACISEDQRLSVVGRGFRQVGQHLGPSLLLAVRQALGVSCVGRVVKQVGQRRSQQLPRVASRLVVAGLAAIENAGNLVAVVGHVDGLLLAEAGVVLRHGGRHLFVQHVQEGVVLHFALGHVDGVHDAAVNGAL